MLAQLGDSLTSYKMPLAYLLITFAWAIYWLLAMIHNSVAGLKDKMLHNSENAAFSCCTLVFASWDFCIEAKALGRKKHRELRQLLKTEIKEQDRITEERNLTDSARRKRTALRTLTLLIVLLLLGASCAAIYFAVEYSQKGQLHKFERAKTPLFGQ